MVSAVGHIALEAVIIITSLTMLFIRIYLNIRTPGGRVKALIISDWLMVSAQVMGTLFLISQIWKNIILMESNDPFLFLSPAQLKVRYSLLSSRGKVSTQCLC